MQDLLQSLGERLDAERHDQQERVKRLARSYRCRCGNLVFFDSAVCPACMSEMAFLPDEGRVAPLDRGPEPGFWRMPGRKTALKTCGNRHTPAACNWVTDATPGDYCIACRLNRTIPNLDDPDNARYWAKIERAKRRLVSQLLALGLPVRSKVWDDPENGLMFDFLRSYPGEPRVITGHASGLITLNVEEADDAKREQMKQALHEPYRTLLGHFRHEVGHYYWNLLIWDTEWLEPCRALFGDERASYSEAIDRHYKQGPPADWAERHISAYATMHPWEDWAETWAHYLHLLDGLATAIAFGFDPEVLQHGIVPFGKDALYAPEDRNAPRFLELLNGWLEMTLVLNSMAQSMGQPDFYPFTMSRPVVAKLQFVQMVVFDARTDAEL